MFFRTGRQIVEVMFKSLFCMETTEISLLYALWYIKTGGGILRSISISNGSQVNLTIDITIIQGLGIPLFLLL